MLRTRCCRASGRTREHEYGEERTRFFSPSRGCSSCRSRCFCGTAGRRLGELPYPFSCMPSGPFLPHPRARGAPGTTSTGTRRQSENAESGKSVCCLVSRYRLTAPGAIWGRLPAGGSSSRPLHGSSGGGAPARGGQELTGFKVWYGMVAPDYTFAGIVQICR